MGERISNLSLAVSSTKGFLSQNYQRVLFVSLALALPVLLSASSGREGVASYGFVPDATGKSPTGQKYNNPPTHNLGLGDYLISCKVGNWTGYGWWGY